MMSRRVEAINLRDKLGTFSELWCPKIIGALNGQHVKLAKAGGEFVWHTHENEDELFFVLDGHLTIHFRDGRVELSAGELYIVPRGVEHKPVAELETHLLLFEPDTTVNTGGVRNDLTVEDVESI